MVWQVGGRALLRDIALLVAEPAAGDDRPDELFSIGPADHCIGVRMLSLQVQLVVVSNPVDPLSTVGDRRQRLECASDRLRSFAGQGEEEVVVQVEVAGHLKPVVVAGMGYFRIGGRLSLATMPARRPGEVAGR